MTRRTPTIDPELRAHQEWLGYLQPVGLVVAPAAMVDAGWVVTRSGSELIDRQERYREAIQGLSSASDCADPEPEADGDTRTRGFPQLETLLVEHLGWSADQIQSEPALIESYSRHLPELGETLRPTALVPAAHGEGIQLLLQALPSLAPLDQKGTSGEHLWRATSQERFERLLRETGVEAGLLFNGAQLRLVVAPKGESSGHLTFPLAELGEVGGRLMFAGLELLLGQSPVFLDPDGYRLSDVLARLLALNAERYGEEVALGLHNKGAKPAAKASTAGASAGADRPRPSSRARLSPCKMSRSVWRYEPSLLRHSPSHSPRNGTNRRGGSASVEGPPQELG